MAIINLTTFLASEIAQNAISRQQIKTDSRLISAGDVFVALQGAVFDGHAFVKDVFAQQPLAVIISNKDLAAELEAESPASACSKTLGHGEILPAKNIVLVEDCLVAYQEIAAFYRKHFLKKVVAISGSVGKTSTRAMLSAALGSCLATASTKDNLNNEIGVPQTILSTPGTNELLVLEMGMDHPHDLTPLSLMARPDIAILTNIGISHLQNFKNQEALVAGKAEIIKGLNKSGILILNLNDANLCRLAMQLHKDWRIVGVYTGSIEAARTLLSQWGNPDIPILVGFDIAETFEVKTGFRLSFCCQKIKASGAVAGGFTVAETGVADKAGAVATESLDAPRQITLDLLGSHHIGNALIAMAVADYLGLDLDMFTQGLRNYRPVGNRQNLISHNGLTILDDSYNAAPLSMRSALHSLARLAAALQQNQLIVLGSMNELEPLAEQEHYALGEYLAKMDIAGSQKILLFGPYAADVYRGFQEHYSAESVHSPSAFLPLKQRSCRVLATKEALISYCQAEVDSHPLVLVKGSRSYRLEEVTAALLASDRRN